MFAFLLSSFATAASPPLLEPAPFRWEACSAVFHWPMHMEACTWLPAILLFVVRAFRSGQSDRRVFMEASLAGLCLGLSILTGGIHFAMMSGIGAVLVIVYIGLNQNYSLHPRASVRRVAIVLLTFAAVAVGVGGPQLIPSLEYGHYALRFIKGGWFPMSEKIPYDRMDGGANPQSLLTGLLPRREADPCRRRVLALLRWRAAFFLWPSGQSGDASRSPLGPLVFHLVSRCSHLSTRWVNSRRSTACSTCSRFLSFGTNREPTRFLFLASFSLAGLAAFGLDNLLTRGSDAAIWPSAPYRC